MDDSSRDLLWLSAAGATIIALFSLFVGDWLSGVIRLTFAVTFGVLASGSPEGTVAQKWVACGLLALALLLIGVQWFGRLSGI